MTAYALFHGWVQGEIDGIQINGKNYSTSKILALEADNAALTARVKELEGNLEELERDLDQARLHIFAAMEAGY